MELYELLIGVINLGKCSTGKIWCTDGRFVSASQYVKGVNLKAFGYALNDHTVVGLKMSEDKCSWCSSNSRLMSFIGSTSLTNGAMNSSMMSALSGSDEVTALSEVRKMTNAGRFPYLPSILELKSFYSALVKGDMYQDLLHAGNSLDECNYLGMGFNNIKDWDKLIWSSTEEYHQSFSSPEDIVSLMSCYSGGIERKKKTNAVGYLIPFFKFDEYGTEYL